MVMAHSTGMAIILCDLRMMIAQSTGITITLVDVIMGAMVSQITSLTIIYSTVCSGADHKEHQSFTTLAFARGIHW